MKMRVSITAVKDNGDTIEITGQGKTRGANRYIGLRPVIFSVPASPRNNRTYHNGRILEITVTTK